MDRAEPTSTATAVTTASPTISAAAVALVRRGLRMVFPRASAPTRAGSQVSGAPAAAASGPASSGPAMVTPKKHSPAPMAVTATAAPVSSPAKSSVAPVPVTASAAASRRPEKPGAPGAASRSACTGATLAARYAGASAAASATTSPMAQASATWAGGTDSPVTGRATPNADNSAARPLDTASPRMAPAAAPAAPTRAASASTERNTWPRPAPSARSSASCRDRWPIMIENVFQITNAPTNIATPANAAKKVVSTPSWLLSWRASAAEALAAVTACTPAGRTLATSARSRAGLTPATALTSIVSYRPGWPNSRCAAGRLKIAIDPPAMLAAPPYPVIPLMVNGSARPPMATSMWSPTAKWPARAEPRSIMTCPGPAGGRPCRPVNTAWNGAWLGQLSAATNGAGSGLPSRPSSTARPLTVPSAAATSGSARTDGSTHAGTGCAAALPAPWTAPGGDTCRTCTSVPAAAWANSESRLWVRVAVNTKLPAIRPVPRATASAVMASRARWLRRLANMARNMSVTPQGRVEGGHPVQHRLRGRPVKPAGDPPVGEEDDPVGVAGGHRVVGDHDDRLAELAHAAAEQVQDLRTGPGVEVAGGLVGEDDLRPAGQGPRDGDPLLLPAGQLRRAVPQPRAQAHRVHNRAEPGSVGGAPRDVQREGDIVRRGEGRQQVVGLEDEADVVAAQPGQPALRQRGDLGAADPHPPAVGAVQPRHAVHERGLTGPGRSHDGGEGPGADVQ